jgi:haloacetate dehalogenase
MLDGFSSQRIATPEAEIFVRAGGKGPPLVCLHGYPQTHLTWRKVAPLLAEHFTVVLPDNRGYGDSAILPSDPAHETYSKRAMARDVVAVMQSLGYDRFYLAGHDRGGRIAYRLALDAPERVAALATLDIITTLDTLDTLTARSAARSYHWYFLSQPEPLPERLIGNDPDFYLDWTIDSWTGIKGSIEEEAMHAYRAWFRKPGAIHAACEDYRAGLTCDVENDRRDRDAGKKIAAPMLVLWGTGPTTKKGFDYLGAWRTWAADVRGGRFDCGHFLMEEAPEPTARALIDFFSSIPLGV